jgi:methionyl-tRNA synthetase
MDDTATALVAAYVAAMSAHDLRGGAIALERLVGEADAFVSASAPWSLAKAGRDEELDAVLADLARTLLRLALMSAPFMPAKAAVLWEALGQSGRPDGQWRLAEQPDLGGVTVTKPENLFPKS